jgi:hypothetical protein
MVVGAAACLAVLVRTAGCLLVSGVTGTLCQNKSSGLTFFKNVSKTHHLSTTKAELTTLDRHSPYAGGGCFVTVTFSVATIVSSAVANSSSLAKWT